MKNQRGAIARRNLALLLVVAVAALAAAAVFMGKRAADNAPLVRPPEAIEDYLFWEAKELTGFRLTGADGRALEAGGLKGKWSFIFFGYTQCPDVCPLTMGILAKTFALIGNDPAASREIQGIFISVDPARDTPQLLKEYTGFFGDRFTGYTGDTAQLDTLTRQMSALYTIHAGEPEQPGAAKQAAPGSSGGSYQVTHSSTVFLVDPQGRLYGRFPPPHLPQEIADVFLKIRAFYNEGANK